MLQDLASLLVQVIFTCRVFHKSLSYLQENDLLAQHVVMSDILLTLTEIGARNGARIKYVAT